MLTNYVGNCGFNGPPPPDSILSMPPPPLPSFLLPKTAIIALPANDTYPCFASFMCDPNPHPRESGMEFVELTGSNSGGWENSWLFILISSCVGVLILGALLAIILLKCRDCHISYHDNNIKQGAMSALGESTKSNPFLAGGILYPCTSANGRDTLQSQLANDSRLLWATLTPHGTRHFITDYPDCITNTGGGHLMDTNDAGGKGAIVPGGPDMNGHYEIVDYRGKTTSHNYRDYIKKTPIKSFDNNGFTDYDYEDPTPLMDSYHDDMDSGYQEPQECIGTIQRLSPRPHVSSPTRIDHPNIPPLNYYPVTNRSQQNSAQNSLQRMTPTTTSIATSIPTTMPTTMTMTMTMPTTMTRKVTMSRRISDASSSSSWQNSQNI